MARCIHREGVKDELLLSTGAGAGAGARAILCQATSMTRWRVGRRHFFPTTTSISFAVCPAIMAEDALTINKKGVFVAKRGSSTAMAANPIAS